MIHHDLSRASINHIKIFQHDLDFKRVFENKIVVDMGSGMGRLIPFISLFSPSSIISVEPNLESLSIQKDFLSNKFAYLPNKKLKNITYFANTLEEFKDQDQIFDTIFFFDSIFYMKEIFDGIDGLCSKEYQFKILKYFIGKNIVISQGIEYNEKEGIRDPSHDDFIDILSQIGYKNIVCKKFNIPVQKKPSRFVILASID